MLAVVMVHDDNGLLVKFSVLLHSLNNSYIDSTHLLLLGL